MKKNGPIRSPSPLFGVDDVASEETTSPELTEVQSRHRKRPSEGTPITRHPSLILSRALNQSLSVDTGGKRSSAYHSDPEEKGRRAAAAEGLDKSDKRRMQDKFAQRAFRARSKIANKHVSRVPTLYIHLSCRVVSYGVILKGEIERQAAGRLVHLEELAKQQVGWIENLTELVERLQKENHALVTAKFQKEKT